MKRMPLIAANWKMFKTGTEAVLTAKQIATLAEDVLDIEIVIAPSFTAITLVNDNLKNINSRIKVGAQTLFYVNEGAYTGEISANMLKDAGVTHVIIGHSERRQLFGETNEDVCKKIKTAVEFGLIPIMCVGETESEKNDGKTFYVLDKQIQNGLKGLRSTELSTLVIAYEPVWAIGSGKTATPEQAKESHRFIRDQISKLCGNSFAEGMRIIYGGSVKPDNISELMSFDDIDGALVGGASLDAESFIKIVKYKRMN